MRRPGEFPELITDPTCTILRLYRLYSSQTVQVGGLMYTHGGAQSFTIFAINTEIIYLSFRKHTPVNEFKFFVTQ
jgi:hypothetical protein